MRSWAVLCFALLLWAPPALAAEHRIASPGGGLTAVVQAGPPPRSSLIKSLAKLSPKVKGRTIKDVSLLGGGSLEWKQDDRGLSVQLPDRLPSSEAIGLRIRGVS